MSSLAQINANRENAKHSTGPITDSGKSRASQNSTKLGLFARRDYVPDDLREEYNHLRDSLTAQLSPCSPLEEALTREIVSAQWRLERCAQIEANLTEAPELTPTGIAIERARASASRTFWRALRELRRIQTDQTARRMTVGDSEAVLTGLVHPGEAVHAARIWEDYIRTLRSNITNDLKTKEEAADQTSAQNEANPTPEHPRNAPCTCGSGLKYKRCCGVSAPPRLHVVA